MSEISRSIQRFQLGIDEAKVRLPQSESMHFIIIIIIIIKTLFYEGNT